MTRYYADILRDLQDHFDQYALRHAVKVMLGYLQNLAEYQKTQQEQEMKAKAKRKQERIPHASP